MSLAASGRSLSVQAWNLVPAIGSLDRALGSPPDERVVEVHPELAFRAADPTAPPAVDPENRHAGSLSKCTPCASSSVPTTPASSSRST